MGESRNESSVRLRVRTALQTVPDAAALLTSIGWPVPLSLTVRQMHALSQLDPPEIDRFLLRYYTEDNHARFVRLAEELVFNTPVLRPWQFMLAECADAHKAGHYRLTIPALLTVAEGVVVGGPGQPGSFMAALNSLPSRIETGGLGGDLDLALLAANQGFLNRVFASARFDGDRPEVLNRHWILHGRDVASWTQIDSLRMFVAVNGCSKLMQRCCKEQPG